LLDFELHQQASHGVASSIGLLFHLRFLVWFVSTSQPALSQVPIPNDIQ
jgi:hypothetical protein